MFNVNSPHSVINVFSRIVSVTSVQKFVALLNINEIVAMAAVSITQIILMFLLSLYYFYDSIELVLYSNLGIEMLKKTALLKWL